MSENSKPWQTYEEVAQYLLNEFASHFGLGRVEGKQIVPGQSGTAWELDAKGVTSDGAAFVIVECRRHTTSSLPQESIGGLAFRILDAGASGGIVVTPLDLQSGAKKVAAHSNIVHVVLSPDSTTTEYLMRFLDRVFIGVADTCSTALKESSAIEVFQDGKLIDKRHHELGAQPCDAADHLKTENVPGVFSVAPPAFLENSDLLKQVESSLSLDLDLSLASRTAAAAQPAPE